MHSVTTATPRLARRGLHGDSTTCVAHPAVDSHSGTRSLIGCLVSVCCLVPAGGCSLISQGQNTNGVVLYQQGYYQGAMQRFQQALASDPKNPDSYYNLAATHHRLGTLNHSQADLDQAENYYNQCLDNDLKHNHRDCYRALAVLLVEQNRTDEAFRLLEGWSNLNPTAAGPRVELARLSEETGNRVAAKERLQEALTLDPHDARALAALGRLHEHDGNTAQALANYQRSLGQDRFQPEVASRVASLRGALTGAATAAGGTVAGDSATRTVNTPPAGARR